MLQKINKYKNHIIKYTILLITFCLYIYFFDYINDCVSCVEIDKNKKEKFDNLMNNDRALSTWDYQTIKIYITFLPWKEAFYLALEGILIYWNWYLYVYLLVWTNFE